MVHILRNLLVVQGSMRTVACVASVPQVHTSAHLTFLVVRVLNVLQVPIIRIMEQVSVINVMRERSLLAQEIKNVLPVLRVLLPLVSALPVLLRVYPALQGVHVPGMERWRMTVHKVPILREEPLNVLRARRVLVPLVPVLLRVQHAETGKYLPRGPLVLRAEPGR